MRFKTLLIVLILSTAYSFSQQNYSYTKGKVTYLSDQNVYVTFDNTDGINVGDTLYIQKTDNYQPALLVNNLSSISCLCTAINSMVIPDSTIIYARKRIVKQNVPLDVEAEKSKQAISVNDQLINNMRKKEGKKSSFGKIDGRISVSSYTVGANDSLSPLYQRFRYNLSLEANHIAHSKFSFETNMSFSHRLGYSDYLFNELKVYSLSASYDITKTARISVGRRLNTNLASIGAVDGIQFENRGKTFSYGAVVGSRPDTYYYTFNPNLMEFGAYVSHHYRKGSKSMQTTLAFFNQTNNWLTDRRFAYIQHSNALLNNLDFFGSAEVDLYGLVNWQPTFKPSLTNLYLSLNYRPFDNFNMSLSYDARKNVYYYQTYKNYIDSLIDKETRQGFRLHFHYRTPIKFLNWGGWAGYRLPTDTMSESLNGNTYLTYSELPFINAMGRVDVTYLKTPFAQGLIYGATLSKDFLKGYLYTDLSYQYVDYTYKTGSVLRQNIADLSLGWQLTKKLLLSADFEGTLDTDNFLTGRLYLNLTKRF